MKRIVIILSLFSLTAFGQSQAEGEQMTKEKWDEEAKTNIRLLPKYGHVQKTEDQKNADRAFIETALKQDSTQRKASDHLISLGFRYLYRDTRAAMYRFNQAYLLDSTNTDIYWGFGGVYMVLGDIERAEKYYSAGLAIEPGNTHLLTDYGTCFMTRYYALKQTDQKSALKNLDYAITHMLKSYQLNPTDPNTLFKLSVCYFNKSDCNNAVKYYELCKALGGRQITEAYTADLKKKCK